METCHEMLQERGHEVVATSFDELLSRMLAMEAVMEGYKTETRRRTLVYIHTEEKIGVKHIRSLVDQVKDDCNVIYISVDGPTHVTRKEAKEYVTFFLAKDIFRNVTKHALVPRHERVDAPPHGVDATDLPVMLESDRIAQYYDWKVGTIVRITRVFGGHETYPYYRIVIGTPIT